MRRVFEFIVSAIRRRPGFFVLIILLTVISAVTIKPNFALLGWDNYSSYFRPDINVFRTLFATWRDYRGLGVPSDAEVTDVFRQVFLWALRVVVPENLLDQVYYLVALWVGILSMYGLAGQLFKNFHFRNQLATQRQKDIFGSLAALFYLCNLNTLSVFYSPIIPFTNRFYSLPLTLYIFLRFLDVKHKARAFLLFALTIIVTSGSFITPTVIITTLLALSVFLFFQVGIKKTIATLAVFLLLNSFWILPFVNYTLQKAAIVPLARTFIEINESTLNRPASDFSLVKQAILTPSFFDINFPSLAGQSFPLHPLQNDYTKQPIRFVLFLFPLLYGFGALLILFQWRKKKKILWIPFWIIVFLFLSTKEFGPVGFIYLWLKDHIPLFDVVFRISDTKFHAYVSLAGSFAAAYTIVFCLGVVQKKSVKLFTSVMLGMVILGYSFLFRSYFTGNLIGFFVYTKVPDAYYDIAKTINDTSGSGRVLHLPMDTWYSYWRSYTWGYIGSSFFNYFINKPYIDKTFEPASLENSYLHGKITTLIESWYKSRDTAQRKEIARAFVEMARRTGIQYVLLDDTVNSSIYSRNVLFTAKQWYVQANDMFASLGPEDGVIHQKTYTIPLPDIYRTYASLYPSRTLGSARNAPTEGHIDVYEITGSLPVFEFLPATQNVDPGLGNLFETEKDMTAVPLIQDAKKPAELLPFMQERHEVSRDKTSFTLTYANPNPDALSYAIDATSSADSYLVDINGHREKNNLVLSFYNRYYPDINGRHFSQGLGSVTLTLGSADSRNSNSSNSGNLTATIVSNWTHTSTDQILDAYRLKINDVFLPLPAELSPKDTYIASVMIHEKNIHAALFTKAAVEPISVQAFAPLAPSDCLGGGAIPEGAIQNTANTSLALTSQNGSTCVRHVLVIPPKLKNKLLYSEIELALSSQSSKEDSTHAYVCLHDTGIEACLNDHKHVRVESRDGVYRIPTSSFISSFSPYVLDIGAVATDALKNTVNIHDIKAHIYTGVSEKTLGLTPVFPKEEVTVSGPLQVSFPKALSPYAYMHKPAVDTFAVPLDVCRGGGGRSIFYNGDTIFSSMKDCGTYFAQQIHYLPGLSYLFAFDYWLGSGQQPTIVMGLKGDNFFLERASIYQGYPNLRGRPSVSDLHNVPFTHASRFIPPLWFSPDGPQDAVIHLAQDTASVGTLGVGAFDFVEYPAAWQGISLTPEGSHQTYQTSRITHTRELLPSLWKMDVEGSGGMLFFNEGYDSQWGIYDSLWAVALGKSLTPSIKCEGFANCFDLTSIQNSRNQSSPDSGNLGKQTFYVFYWPERLAIAGWGMTVLALVMSSILIRKRMYSH